MIRLDEERPAGQHPAQKAAGRIHHCEPPPAFHPAQQRFVAAARHGGRNRTGDHQHIPRLQGVQLLQQAALCLGRNHRPGGVDLGFLLPFDFHVDAGLALRQADKLRPHAPPGQAVFQLTAGEPGHKPQRRGLHAQLVQHTGNIDSLAARLNLCLPGAVGPAHRQLFHPHHVIQGRVEGNRIHHPALRFLSWQARPECTRPGCGCLFLIRWFLIYFLNAAQCAAR